jgi:hypothetical protein
MRAGLRFEENVGKILLLLAQEHGFSYHFQKAFESPEGTKIPDHFWLPKGRFNPGKAEYPELGFVFETKLTWRQSAISQLRSYSGILSSYYSVPFVQVIIAKNLSPKMTGSELISSYSTLPLLNSEGPFTLHSLWPEYTLRELDRVDLPDFSD